MVHGPLLPCRHAMHVLLPHQYLQTLPQRFAQITTAIVSEATRHYLQQQIDLPILNALPGIQTGQAH